VVDDPKVDVDVDEDEWPKKESPYDKHDGKQDPDAKDPR